MSYGYLGDTSSSIKQQKKNAGVLSVSDVLNLKSQGFLGGSLELIIANSFSSSSSITITTLKESVYDIHFFSLVLTGAHQDCTVFLDMSTDGGSSYITDDFRYYKQYIETSSGDGTQTNTDLYGIQIGSSADTNVGFTAEGYLYNLGNANQYSYYTGQSFFSKSGDAGEFKMEYGGGVRPAKDTINAIRFYPNTGTLTGYYKVFGIKQI